MSGDNSSIGRWISLLYRYRQNFLSKKLDPYNIGSGQHIFLMVLSRKDGISQEEISNYLKIDKATTAKAIKKLEDEGYVYRDVDAMDRRAYQVFLTQKALKVIPVIKEAVQDWEKLVTTGLAESDHNLLEEVLEKMAWNACQARETSREA